LGNAFYHAVQNLLFFLLLSKTYRLNKIYKTIILLLVLYGCETWSLTLGEEHRLRVSENRMLRRIFAPNRDEVTGGWRKLQNDKLHNLYSSSNIIRMIKSGSMRWVGHVACMGVMRNVHKILVGKPERRHRYRWEGSDQW
jgi:hypothetical protein